MEDSDGRRLGSVGNIRGAVSKVHFSTPSVKQTPTPVSETPTIAGSYFFPVRKRSSGKGNKSRVARFLQSTISRSQEIRQMETSDRPITAEQTSAGRTLQDGDTPLHSVGNTAIRLGCVNRLRRCLLPHSDASRISEIPPLYRWSQHLPIQSSSIRSITGSKSILTHHVSRSRPRSTSWTPDHSVLRRLAKQESKKRGLTVGCRQNFGSSATSGAIDKLGEIRLSSQSGFHLRGHEIHDLHEQSVHSRSEDCEPKESSVYVPTTQYSLCSEHSVSPGRPKLGSRSDPVGQITLAASTDLVAEPVECPNQLVGTQSDLIVPVSSTPSLVAGDRPLSGCTDYTQRTTGVPVLGRQPSGLGCSFGTSRPDDIREMVMGGSPMAHQHFRNGSCIQSYASFQSGSDRENSASIHGQYDSSLVYSPPRGDTLSLPVRSNVEASDLVSQSECYPIGSSSSRTSQCYSRSPFKTITTPPGGVDSQSGNSVKDLFSSGHTNRGSICNTVQCSSAPICVPDVGSQGLGSGRNVSKVGPTLRICVPTVHAYPSNSQQDPIFHMLDHLDSSVVAPEILVQRPSGSPSRSSPSPPNTTQPIDSVQREAVASQSSNIASSRLEIIRRAVTKAHFSEEVASHVSESRRVSTTKVYDSKWSTFVTWCSGRKINFSSPSIQQIADFLTYLFQVKNLSVSTIKGYRAMLSNTLKLVDNSANPGSDPIISDLIRSFELKRPVSRSLLPKWDLSAVLFSLTRPPFEPLAKADMKFVSWKTVFLLAFASAKRRSELHALSVEPNHIRFNKDRSVSLVFQPGFLAKNQLPSVLPPPLVIPSLSVVTGQEDPDRLLCPVRALKFYLKATEPLRGSRSRLFIPLRGSGDISAATISRWIAATIKFTYAGLTSADLTFLRIKPHEVRALSTSWAFLNCVSLEEVLQAAFWRSETTFSSFYLRSLSKQNDNLRSLGPVVAAQKIVGPKRH